MQRRLLTWLFVLALGVGAPAWGAQIPEPSSGILYDRVVPFSRIERFSGQPAGPAARPATWWQIYDELRRASTAPTQPDPLLLRARAGERVRSGVVPLALLDYRYQRLGPGAQERLRANPSAPVAAQELEEARAFSFTALQEGTWRGGDLTFVLDPSFVFGNVPGRRAHEVDFDDGLGFRMVRGDQPARVRYHTTGEKSLRVRAEQVDGSILEARAAFTVRALVAPSPHDTLHVTASIAYQGQFGSGDAYVYLAPGHTALLNPVVVVEGFDIDNSYNWDELYELLNQQNLIEDLRSAGYDIVVLNFTEATDYLQKNAFVLAALEQQVEAAIPAENTVAMVGASMGGLVARYALAYMESQAIGHRVRTFVSFDVPHAGANIPLGIQYWMKFFSGLSADAAFLLSRLDQPGARQMLAYHYTTPPGATGQADPLRATFLADLTAAGGFPTLPRTVAIANGSGAGAGQGFAPGDQIIRWEYSSPLVALRGNVWAVPNVTSHAIFDGLTRIFISQTTQTVTVSNTQPFDNAPGGSRATMTQMDTTAAPYGDIIALHPSHCFIPTISALALDTSNLFYDVAGDPSLLAHTPFDAVYFPTANQEHVTITPQNATWLRSEIEAGVTAVGSSLPGQTLRLLMPVTPNPAREHVRVRFRLPEAMDVNLSVYGIDGREVAQLVSGPRALGDHDVEWNGRDRSGRDAGAGVFFVRLATADRTESRRFVRFD